MLHSQACAIAGCNGTSHPSLPNCYSAEENESISFSLSQASHDGERALAVSPRSLREEEYLLERAKLIPRKQSNKGKRKVVLRVCVSVLV